jgi:mannose-6-phosphate isomerase-like protein (cupin superfamily)
MDKDVVLLRSDEIEWKSLSGGFKYKFIANGEKFVTGLGVAQPGNGESWHKHTADVEETYYVLKGKGEISWKSGNTVKKIRFSEGDSMYLPFGIENEFINTGKDELWLLFNITKAEKMRE